MNTTWTVVPDNDFHLYEALVLGKSPLTTEFKPKNLDRLKAQYEKERAQVRAVSNLYSQSKIEPGLKALGYTDVAYRGSVDGFISDYYSAEQ